MPFIARCVPRLLIALGLVVGPASVALAQAIRAEGIDVLVDMSGHTTDNRLDVLALRPAPVQISWLGFPASVGAALVDYMVTDAVSAPPDSRAAFDEALIYLPVSFTGLCVGMKNSRRLWLFFKRRQAAFYANIGRIFISHCSHSYHI